MNELLSIRCSGSSLKVIAVISMVMDHCAYFLMTPESRFYDAMRCVGRIAFPIFAFLIVEGFLHTKSQRRYFLALLGFAVLSEIPWLLLNGSDGTHNVLFTLALGVVTLTFLELMLRNNQIWWSITIVLIMALFAFFLGVDYEWRGILMMTLFFVLKGTKESSYPVSRMLQLCFTFPLMAHYGIIGAILASIVLFFYSGSRGFIHGNLSKYLFYAIYPIHLLVIWFVR